MCTRLAECLLESGVTVTLLRLLNEYCPVPPEIEGCVDRFFYILEDPQFWSRLSDDDPICEDVFITHQS